MTIRFYTYLHCRPSGEPFYVGKGKGKRAYDFRQRTYWHKHIVAKYGKASIQVFVFPCESEAQAFADEIQQIAQLRSEGYELCNLSAGGGGPSGLPHTAEWKQAMSERFKDRYFSPETRAKIAASKLGIPRSEETRRKLSAANLGKKASPEHRAKQSQRLKGRVCSEETRQKIAAAHKGKVVSENTKAKLSQSVKAAWADPIRRARMVAAHKNIGD
jgi:hypothetical protein